MINKVLIFRYIIIFVVLLLSSCQSIGDTSLGANHVIDPEYGYITGILHGKGSLFNESPFRLYIVNSSGEEIILQLLSKPTPFLYKLEPGEYTIKYVYGNAVTESEIEGYGQKKEDIYFTPNIGYRRVTVKKGEIIYFGEYKTYVTGNDIYSVLLQKTVSDTAYFNHKMIFTYNPQEYKKLFSSTFSNIDSNLITEFPNARKIVELEFEADYE